METKEKNWENTDIVLEGAIKEHTIVFFEFRAVRDLKIVSLIPSCGCMSPIYDISKRVLTASFNVGSIPIHLVQQGFYIARKNIRIMYEDGSDELLSFSCKVEK